MSVREHCPDCGAAVGECDCEPERVESNEVEPTKDDPGFKIYDWPSSRPQPPENTEKTEEPVAIPEYSDEFRSGACRKVGNRVIFEPVFKDGKTTGEWRVCRRQRHWPEHLCSLGKGVPWEKVLPSEEALEEWIQDVKKEEEQ